MSNRKYIEKSDKHPKKSEKNLPKPKNISFCTNSTTPPYSGFRVNALGDKSVTQYPSTYHIVNEIVAKVVMLLLPSLQCRSFQMCHNRKKPSEQNEMEINSDLR